MPQGTVKRPRARPPNTYTKYCYRQMSHGVEGAGFPLCKFRGLRVSLRNSCLSGIPDKGFTDAVDTRLLFHRLRRVAAAIGPGRVTTRVLGDV